MSRVDDLYATEYGMLMWYDDHRSNLDISNCYFLLSEAIKNNTYTYLDLKSIKNDLNQDLKYLRIRDLFADLYHLSDKSLSYNENGFILDGHCFKTLKEVKRALKLKAFL